MSSVRLQRLSKRFDDQFVVRDVDLEIADGELMVLVGPSGCGKTTVLRMVAGLEPITDGDVLVDGRSTRDVATNDRDLAMVFQDATLYPHLSVAENLGFPLKMSGMRRREVASEVGRLADLIGVRSLLAERPSRLSGGQRQRVALGRALIQRPRLLLMDEPMSHLDAKLRTELRSVIAHLQRRLDVTTLYVTHDQVEAMALGHRLALMRGGRIVQCGPPDELYHRPVDAFVGSFIGSPPMNLMLGTIALRHDRPQVVVDTSSLVLPAEHRLRLAGRDGGRVVVGVRAQAFRFSDAPGLAIDVDTIDQSSGRCVVRATVKAPAVVVAERGVRIEQRPAPIVIDLESDDDLDLELWRRSTLIADPADVHLFDPVSGESLLVADRATPQVTIAAT